MASQGHSSSPGGGAVPTYNWFWRAFGFLSHTEPLLGGPEVGRELSSELAGADPPLAPFPPPPSTPA